MSERWLVFSDEVQAAREAGKPLVALESTMISHGMPYPQNLETAHAIEGIIRAHGAVPATIAIVDGKIKIGLSASELEALATRSDVLKVSRRDIPYALTQRKMGATTVSATMIAARLAGIAVFVTGGIGGVHRDVNETLDISADLTELAQTNVAVVCAGAKAILDIGRTLEYLETQGVPVVGYQTDEFPAFYTRTSGFRVDYRLDTPQEVAALLKAKWDLGLAGGVVVANPIPADDALDEAVVRLAVDTALAEAKAQNIRGKAVTPFLLRRVKELTGGASLKANIALVQHNARVGTEIAVAYQALCRCFPPKARQTTN